MNNRTCLALSAGIFALLTTTPAVQAGGLADAAPGGPERVLVYAYTYSESGDLQEHGTNGFAHDTRSGAGMSRDYNHTLGDKGTITVDVIKEQHDRGLIVRISEQGQQTRTAPAAECAVYGDTITIVCDPEKTMFSEEMTLLRFLGTTFVDPNLIDAQKHWKIDVSSNQRSTVADFTIEKNANGIMTIGESRTIKELVVPQITTNVDAKIAYDFNRLIPISIDESTILRQGHVGGATMTTTVQTTLVLQTDSMH
jgi:hypothetical protein